MIPIYYKGELTKQQNYPLSIAGVAERALAIEVGYYYYHRLISFAIYGYVPVDEVVEKDRLRLFNQK